MASLLHPAGFRLQANAKQVEGARHVARNAPFTYRNGEAEQHPSDGCPMITVNTEK